MNAKHTPGPWFLEITSGGLWVGREKAVGGKCGDVIVGLEYGDDYKASHNDQALADARLIAAAPDLLELAIECRKQIDHIIEDGATTDWRMWRDDLDAAISKATTTLARIDGEGTEA